MTDNEAGDVIMVLSGRRRADDPSSFSGDPRASWEEKSAQPRPAEAGDGPRLLIRTELPVAQNSAITGRVRTSAGDHRNSRHANQQFV